MVVLSIIGIVCIGILLFMYKQAHENNLRIHEVQTTGKQETLRLFFISDTHARKINKAMIESIHQKVDAVIIGGDFVDRRTTEETLFHNIRLLKQLGPTYFVWGNNDVEYGIDKLRRLFEQHQITVVENASIELISKNNVRISGLSYRSKDENIKLAVEHCEEDNTIFIAHNPELFPTVFKQFQPLLSLAGHLHGGQIRWGKYGIQPHGYFKKVDARYELVSNGYGTTLLPLRFGAKSECHLITIHFEQNPMK